MNEEEFDSMRADIAAAHQEINKLRCQVGSTGMLVIMFVVLSGAFGLGVWVSLGGALVVSTMYGTILWLRADKPFERLMNEPYE